MRAECDTMESAAGDPHGDPDSACFSVCREAISEERSYAESETDTSGADIYKIICCNVIFFLSPLGLDVQDFHARNILHGDPHVLILSRLPINKTTKEINYIFYQ